MPNHISHVPKNRVQHQKITVEELRGYSEDTGVILAQFLNGRICDDDGSAPGDRKAVADLVGHLQKLETLSAVKDERTSPAEFEKTLIWINAFLNQYKATPEIRAEKRVPSWDWEIYWKAEGNRTQTIELHMVHYVLELVQLGRTSSLKQCAQCGDWLFARFSHQRFCSDDCYKQFHKTNEADKKRRRDWARDDYRNKKRKKRSRLHKQA